MADNLLVFVENIEKILHGFFNMIISSEFYEMLLEALHNQKYINNLPPSDRKINQYIIDRVYQKGIKKLEKYRKLQTEKVAKAEEAAEKVLNPLFK